MSEDSSKPAVKWGWKAALGVSVLSVVLAQAVVAVIAITLGWDINSLSRAQTYALGSLSVALPLAGLYLYLPRVRATLEDLGFDKKPKPFIKPLAKAFGLYILSTTAAILLLSVLAPTADLDQAQDLGLGDNPAIWYEFLLLGLLLTVFTPFSEEVIFRGFMLKGLAGRFGWTAAAVVSSLLFGIVHGQLNVAIDTGIMGWFSAQLVIATKSIWPSIALHALKNSIAFTLVYLGPLVS
ncbi:MAG TPA: type II CAAX endopeptidase family protein [Candidatus Saccharimonadales bacterium]